jgi:GMP synthase (glutamine-hydrolysing)
MASADKSRVLAVVHQETSRTGRVGQLLECWGYEVERCCPNIGHALPDDLSPYAGVVMFGGPMSANDCTSLPGIKAELAWLPRVLDTNTPFLGICLGAQLMARVMGAKVNTHPEGRAEIGYVEIEPVHASCQIFPEKMHVYQWHREGFDLPRDCTLLARGEHFENQAYRYGERVYGVQFHPEVTLEMKQIWTVKGAERLKMPGAQPADQHIDLHPVHDPKLGVWTERFLRRWLRMMDRAAHPQAATA